GEGGDALVARDRATARGANRLHDLVGDPARGAAAVDRTAQVVHDDGRAFRRQQLGDRPADAPPRAGDNRGAPLQPIAHRYASFAGAGFASPSTTVRGASSSSSS